MLDLLGAHELTLVTAVVHFFGQLPLNEDGLFM